MIFSTKIFNRERNEKMQIKLTLETNGDFYLPFNYYYPVQSAIFAKLREVGASDFFHDEGFGEEKKFKAFVFGRPEGKYETREKNMVFPGGFSIEVRSPLFSFCDALQRSAEIKSKLRIGDALLDIVGIGVANRHINTGHKRFKTNSPVIVRKTEGGKSFYYSPEDPYFFEGLITNLYSKYESVTGERCGEISVRPIGDYRKVVTRYKNIWITGYLGSFDVSGPPAALEFIYNTGLGEKNSQGFGMVD